MAVLAQEPFAAEYSTTTGDGAITLGGRIGNYKTLAEVGVADTNVVMAEIRLVSGGVTTEYEMGFYTYASSGPTLTIVGSPLRSSNSNNKVSWSAGTKQVVLSAPPFLYPRDDRFVLVGSADWTKRARFEVDGITAGQTRVITLPDRDLDLATPVFTGITLGTQPIRNSASSTYTTATSLSTTIPADDTIPTSSEGTEVITVSLSASSATAKVRIEFNAFGAHSSGTNALIAALFMDSETSARRAVAVNPEAANSFAQLRLVYEFTPGDTSSHTYRIRVGASSGTMVLNGNGGSGRIFGGVSAATLTATEV